MVSHAALPGEGECIRLRYVTIGDVGLFLRAYRERGEIIPGVSTRGVVVAESRAAS